MRVLVTGGSGVVGAEVAAELAHRGCAVVAMLHQNPQLKRNSGQRVRTVEGAPTSPVPGSVMALKSDVRDPFLGWGEDLFSQMARSFDLIVNCAAITDFNRDKAVYEAVNVKGTVHALALAKSAPKPTPFLHVSTAYVSGEREGRILEDDLVDGKGFGNSYEESKFRAERLVHEAAAEGLPFAIARPSIIVGTTRTGRIREFKHLYLVLKLLTEGKVRSMPANYDATLDLVPVDYVVAGIVQIATRMQEANGRTFHLVSRVPATLRDFSDVIAEYPSMHVPRFVVPRAFDVNAMQPIERRLYNHTIRVFEGYCRRRVEFVNDGAVKMFGAQLPTIPAPRVLLRKQLDYCESVGYLGRPARAALEAAGDAGGAEGTGT
jgi:nucleoside-diphosphate-sugar epimerase